MADTQAGSTTKYCSSCGAEIKDEAEICPECGVRQKGSSGDNTPEKIPTALFAMLLGGFGAHKFYLGETGMGFLYLCFSWTGIPSIVGLIEGIIYLTKSDAEFEAQYA